MKLIKLIFLILIGIQINAQNITQAEYFWDVDPGEGNANPMIALDGNFSNALEDILKNNATLPTNGNHVLGLRIKSSDGKWSPVYRRVFRAIANNNSNNSVKITQAEYFWDSDPGEGNANPMIAFDGNFSNALEDILKNNATLPTNGNHVLGLRIKSSDGKWSPVYRRVFRAIANNNSNNSVKITQAEYFWDSDPGEGNANPMIALDGNFSNALEDLLATNSNVPNQGLHIIGIRVKGDDGIWAPVYKKVVGVDISFIAPNLISLANDSINANIMDSLKWNSISGANAYQIVISSDSSFSNIIISDTVSDTTYNYSLNYNSKYYWRVRVVTNNQTSPWSVVWNFYTMGCSPINTVKNDSICNGQTYSFNNQTLNLAGTYYDTITLANGCDSIIQLNLKVNPTVTPNIVINTPNSNICQGNSISFTSTISGGGSAPIYAWKLNGSIVGNGTNLNLSTINNNDVVLCELTSNAACSSPTKDTSNSITIKVFANTTSSHSENLCFGDSIFFNNQYLKSTGTYHDTIMNSMGCDSIIELNLNVYPQININIQQNGLKLTSSTGFNSYQWKLNGNVINGANTDTLLVNQNGTYTLVVTDNNACKDSVSIVVSNVGIEKILDKKTTLIYPNPSNGVFNFNFSSIENREVKIYDVSGKLIYHNSTLQQEFQINLDSYRQGLYFAEIIHQNNEREIVKLILHK